MNHILTASAGGFDGMMNSVLMALLLLSGIYGLYTVIRLHRTLLLFPNKFLYPGNCKPEDCLDEDGFIDYILPRLTIWSIVMLVLGIFFTLNVYVIKYNAFWFQCVLFAVPIVVLIWLMLIQRVAAKRYWDL